MAGLAASVAQNIPSIQFDRILPKFSKISPAAGLKRLTGQEGLVQFGKNAFKLIAIGFVVFLLIHSELQTVTDSMFVQPITIPDRMLGVLTRMISGVAVAFVLLAGIDIVYSRVSWRKKMRMTKQEIKDEMKQSEGDPIFKAKRRSIALDRARRRMIARRAARHDGDRQPDPLRPSPCATCAKRVARRSWSAKGLGPAGAQDS